MSKEDKPPPSPSHGLFDPTHLLGAPSLGLAAGLPFPHLAHLPAYPWLARPAFHPALFGGLGGLPSPLLAHGLPHTSAADFGGAEWWRAASEHARRGDLFMSSLGPPLTPTFSTRNLESSTPGLEFLLTAPSDGDKPALFSMSKHLSDIPSTSTSSPSPSKRSRTPTPAPAHQKSSKSSTSTSSSSKDLHHVYLPFSIDGKDAWHLNGSAFNMKSLTSQEGSSLSRKRRHKEARNSFSSREGVKVGKTSFFSNASHSGSGNRVAPEVEDGGVLNLSKSAPSAAVVCTPPPVTPGVEDLSLKKPDKESKATNGTGLSDSDSPNVSSPASNVSDGSDDGNMSDSEKDKDKLPSHQIDGNRKQLIADQIRQQLLSSSLSSSPAPSPANQTTPLVIPSLRLRHGKDKDSKTSASRSQLPALNFTHDFGRPENLLLDRDVLSLPSTSSALHTTSSHATSFSFLPTELRLNHQSKEESQDSLLSVRQSEATDDKMTSGSERLMDSESPSGWGSEDDAAHNQTSSSASPGPSYTDDPSKRRNIVLNEKELLLPLEHGWQRRTTIHGMGRRGIVGEVLYFAPCNKKMKTIPDVMRYLDRHAITDLSRENFTFNTKVNVGQFYEIRDKQVVPLTETEILERIAMSKGKRARMQMLARKKCEKQLRQQALAKQLMEAKYKKRQEQQDMARKAAEMKFQMRLEKEQQKEMAKKVKEVKLLERQREKERSRLLKQQEKIRQQEQLRIEREMRAQQILEARRRRQVELEEMRLKEIARKNQEREMKKQQQIMEKEQEKERRRQHLLLVKALEQRKKQEEKQEKERQREEKIREKNLERERKLAQRQIEMLIAREMKKPMDDMELRDGKPLPKFPRCPEAKLPGPAFSDCLMIVEFVHNFADALGLDSESLPTLEVLQNGLLNTNDEDVEEVVTLYLHLLRFALDDLGVPNPRAAMTALNQKITDLEITDATMSEVTRLFLFAHGERQMSHWLEEIPLEALNATKKAAIIAFLCNELLSSKRLSGEIERTLESINTLRRDKWIVEGKLRKLRTLRARKYLKLELMSQTPQPVLDEDSMTNTTNTSSKAISDEEEEKDEEDDEKDEEEEMESCDDNSTTGNRSEDEDEGLSKDEMEKKIEKLVKQHNSFDSKVADVSKQLRGTCLGQDRYKRFYWILPSSGGIFVEGIESGETEALPFEMELLAKQKAKREKSHCVEVAEVKEEKCDVNTDTTQIKGDVKDSKNDEVKSVKLESDTDSVIQRKNSEDQPSEEKNQPGESKDQSLVSEKNDNGEDSVGASGKGLSDSVSNGCVSHQGYESKAVNVCTQSSSVSTNTPATFVQTALLQEDRTNSEKTGCLQSVAELSKGTTSASISSYQEPILSKLSDLLRLPHLHSTWQISDPRIQSDIGVARSDICVERSQIEAAVTTVSLTVSSQASSTLSSTSSSSSTVACTLSPVSASSAVSLTMSSLPTVTSVVSTAASTVSHPSPLITSLPSLSTSSASSTLSSLAAVAATVTSEPNLSAPMAASTPPRVAHTVSSTSTSILSSMPVSTAVSVSMTNSALMVNPFSPMTPLSAVSAISTVKMPASKSLLTESLLSPEFSTSAVAINSGAHSPNTPAVLTTRPCALSPTLKKTLSSTALLSTPLSMLTAMPKVMTLSPSSETASSSLLTSENGPLLQLTSIPVVSSCSSLFSSPHTVSLLNSTPVTSPIPPVSSSPMKDKKSNFASIDALLKKDPESVVSLPSSSTPSTLVSACGNSNNHFLPPNLFPPSPLISEHFLKSYVDILDQKPWFSILPRIPCDEKNLSLPKVSTSSVPGLGMVSSENIASASLSLLSLLPIQQQALQQQQQQQQQKTTMSTSSQVEPSPVHSHSESQSKAMRDLTSAFQAHLSQSSLTDISMAVSTATNTSDLTSLCGDSFKVPAPPSDSLLSESLLDLDPAAELMKIQGERLPIPISKQRGWWKIQDADQVRKLFNSLLSRGVREKNMSYMLRKYMDFIFAHLCTVDSGKNIKEENAEKPAVQMSDELAKKDSDSQSSDSKEVSNTAASECTAVPTVKQEIKTEPEDNCDNKDQDTGNNMEFDEEIEEEEDAIPKEPEDSWSLRVQFEVEMACLEDVEALEDRIFNASLQIKVWKLPQRASEDPEIHMVDRSLIDPKPPNFYPMELARERLLLLESNVERRYLKPPLIRHVQLNLTSLASEKVADSKVADGEGEGNGSNEEHVMEYTEDIPPGLMLWRCAVQNARTPAQLNLCTQLLGNSIAWEKSIMKVTCQICLKDDNEAELLLCDGCDKGYHTYCFKPKMEYIPDGDWYCYECVSKVSGKSHCIVCGGQGGKIVECERCPRAIHTDCLDPPLPRMPKKWQCASCIQTKNKKNSKRKRKEASLSHTTPALSSSRERKDSTSITTKDRKMSENASETPVPSAEKKKKESSKEKKEKPPKEEKKKEDKKKEEKKKEDKKKDVKEKREEKEKKEKKPRERKSKKKREEEAALLDPTNKDADMVMCGKLLLELEKSECGWPFLRPVSSKQFPSYRKYIKQPMDFTTMKNKLKDNLYKNRIEVANDMKLIWSNCEIFNEDDSEVGQAGHNLRRVFTQKWKELFQDDIL